MIKIFKKMLWKTFFKQEHKAIYLAAYDYNENWGNNKEPNKVILYQTETDAFKRVLNLLNGETVQLSKKY